MTGRSRMRLSAALAMAVVAYRTEDFLGAIDEVMPEDLRAEPACVIANDGGGGKQKAQWKREQWRNALRGRRG